MTEILLNYYGGTKMETKLVEIRAHFTKIMAIATKLSSDNSVIFRGLKSAGFGDNPEDYVILTCIENNKSSYNPFYWNTNELVIAHNWIIDNFDKFVSGWTIDTECIVDPSKGWKLPDIYYEKDSLKYTIKHDNDEDNISIKDVHRYVNTDESSHSIKVSDLKNIGEDIFELLKIINLYD